MHSQRRYAPQLDARTLRGLHRLKNQTKRPLTKLLEDIVQKGLQQLQEAQKFEICRLCIEKGFQLEDGQPACHTCAFGQAGAPRIS